MKRNIETVFSALASSLARGFTVNEYSVALIALAVFYTAIVISESLNEIARVINFKRFYS